MRCAIISSACVWPMTRWLSVSAELQHGLDLVLAPCGRPECRSSPATTDADGLLVDASAESAATRPAARELCLQRRAARQQRSVGLRLARSAGATALRLGGALGLRMRPLGRRRRPPACSAPRSFARSSSSRRPAPSRPPSALRAPRAASAISASSAASRRRALVASTPTASSRPMISSSIVERLDAAAAVLELGRRRVLADRPRARRRCRAGSPPCRAAGAPGCSGATARTAASTASSSSCTRWCFSSIAATPRTIRIALSSLGSSTLHDLEAPRQRRVLLDVLLVLGPGGRGDRAQRCRAPAPA